MAELTALQQLAQAHNVGITFRGWDGAEKDVTDETLRKVLRALGVDCDTANDIALALQDTALAQWRRMLPRVVVGREQVGETFAVHAPTGSAVQVWIVTEEGQRLDPGRTGDNAETTLVAGVAVERLSFALPADLPLGWHTLHARHDGAESHCALVITPQRLATTARLSRTWGLMAQLYSVRSSKSWGIGDLADLASLARISAEKGAGFVLINPLHAAEPAPPVDPSPYLPATRRFFNPLYIRVENVPEFNGLDATDRARTEAVAAGFRAANNNSHILDRDTSYAAKLNTLEQVFAVPRSTEREKLFQDFCTEEGVGLDNFALWCALAEVLPPDAAEWSDPAGVATRRKALESRIRFHKWLQWLCDQQLEAAQEAALESGMNIGVVHDLAVGVNANGADAWMLRSVLAAGISVGAPPDMFNQQGQDWGQPPWHPERLAESGYAAYRDMLRTILRHAGGIRVDHILGLFRLWWIPSGAMPGEGAYVYYDHEALIGILALEAQRAGAVVIGEDLGVFEPGVQHYLAERGILGTSILWFEHTDNGPRPASDYRQASLTSVTTHDLPPTAGYLAGEHVDLRESLGLLNRPVEEERAADAEAQEAVLSLVRASVGDSSSVGLKNKEGDAIEVQRTVETLHAFIAQTPSVLLGVALTDAVGERRTQNQPGTRDEYPNWRIPLAGPESAVLLDDLPANERFASLVRALNLD